MKPYPHNRGIDLRDYFAIRILPSVLKLGTKFDLGEDALQLSVKSSYKIADAMMEARKK